MGAALLWGLLCYGLLSHPVALVALGVAVFQRRRTPALALGGVSLAFAALALTLGVGGYLWGMHQVEVALGYAAGEVDGERTRALGQADAMLSVWCGLASAAVPGLLGALALVRGLALRPEGG